MLNFFCLRVYCYQSCKGYKTRQKACIDCQILLHTSEAYTYAYLHDRLQSMSKFSLKNANNPQHYFLKDILDVNSITQII